MAAHELTAESTVGSYVDLCTAGSTFWLSGQLRSLVDHWLRSEVVSARRNMLKISDTLAFDFSFLVHSTAPVRPSEGWMHFQLPRSPFRNFAGLTLLSFTRDRNNFQNVLEGSRHFRKTRP